jgi:hypothetical protein
VELLAAAGTGGRRRAPEPPETEASSTPEPTAKAQPEQPASTGRRRRAESFERSEIADELRADSGRWRLEPPSTRAAEQMPAVESAEAQPSQSLAPRVEDPAVLAETPAVLTAQSTGDNKQVYAATVPFTTHAGLPHEVLGPDRAAERNPESASMPDAAVASASSGADATVAARSGDESPSAREGRRPRSELADLLAEALVAFESTEHAGHGRFGDEPSVARSYKEPSTVDHYDWQPERSGSRHRQPEPEDRIEVPSTSSEPPMLSDWVLSGKESQPPRSDTSGLGDWAPTPFREDRPAADHDSRPVEAERNWSDWTWTPPER